jgi:hypothetical protein
MVSGVTTTPVGVVGQQGDTGERGDMTGSHQHLRSYAARTLHRGVDHVDATLPHTRVVQNHGEETRAFLSYRGRRWSSPWKVCRGCAVGSRPCL